MRFHNISYKLKQQTIIEFYRCQETLCATQVEESTSRHLVFTSLLKFADISLPLDVI